MQNYILETAKSGETTMTKILVIKYSTCQVNPIFRKPNEQKLSIQTKNYGKDVNYEMKVIYREACYPNNFDNYCLHENTLDIRINLDRAELEIEEIKKLIKKLIENINEGLANIDLLKEIDDLYYEIFKPSYEPTLVLNMKTIGGDFPEKHLELTYYI